MEKEKKKEKNTESIALKKADDLYEQAHKVKETKGLLYKIKKYERNIIITTENSILNQGRSEEIEISKGTSKEIHAQVIELIEKELKRQEHVLTEMLEG